MSNYIVYHLHDDTSNCNGYADSCTKYDEYIELAKKNNMKALAFSNHGGIYDWVKKKQSCDKAKIKYIHGVELYIVHDLKENSRGGHIGLYSKNWEGVKELNALMSISTSKGVAEDDSDRHMYYNPRITFEELFNTSDNIIITSACLASPLWRLYSNYETEEEKQRNFKKLKEILTWMGKHNDRCFLEIQYHNVENQKEYNKLLYKWSRQYNIPLIAGTDTHSSTKYKAECRTVLQKSKDSFYGEEDSFDLTWKSYDELVECFKLQNALSEEVYLEAIENTNKLANMIEEFTLDKSFKYPTLYGDNSDELWKNLIEKKLQYKLNNNIIDKSKLDTYKKEIKIEYEVMTKLGMSSFMMFNSELMDWCRKNDIHSSPCRGSVGGSTIAYITDITDVDPIVWGTVFSRFCNADRISLGDIDQDFSPNDRAKVYEYIIKRFGKPHIAYILSLSTIQDRGSIDVLAKGLDYKDLDLVKEIKNTFDGIFKNYSKIIQEEVNLEELENATSKSPNFDDYDLYINVIRNNQKLKEVKDLKIQWDKLRENNKDLFYYFDGIKGTIIAKGHHPAGIIGSPITLYDNLGIFYDKDNEDFPISSCSMKVVDGLNYVKFDILGLKTIGVLQDTFEMAGVGWKYAHEINWNDEKVWDDMIRCNSGLFQFEGEFAFDLIKKFSPTTINGMSLVNASLRPSGKSYRDRLINREFNKNPSKEIDDLLADNHGFLVFQEDTIKFLTDICGFSGSLADTTRRAIGKKDIELLNEQLPKILDGYCEKSTKPREIAEQEAKEFIQIISDSSEYQFGLNHSTGYSMNGYLCAYARTYYPIEFTTAYLNWAENKVDMDNGMKLLQEYGFKIKSPQFRYSKGKYFFDRETNTIYKGIGSIKFFNIKVGDELYELRKGVYNSFLDLLINIKTKTSCDNRHLDLLIKINFFKEFGSVKKLLQITDLYNKFYGKQSLSIDKLDELGLSLEQIIPYGRKTEKKIIDLDSEKLLNDLIKNIPNEEFPLVELLKMQKEILGYINYTNDKLDKKICLINTFDGKYSTKKVNLYCLNNGKTADFKLYNKIYKHKPIEEGDIIYISSMERKPKPILLGEDENGKKQWGKDMENFEWILNDYNILKEI